MTVGLLVLRAVLLVARAFALVASLGLQAIVLATSLVLLLGGAVGVLLLVVLVGLLHGGSRFAPKRFGKITVNRIVCAVTLFGFSCSG